MQAFAPNARPLADTEAEVQLVSRVVQAGGLQDLTQAVDASWVTDPELREVLEVVSTLWAAGEPVELATVAERLRLPADPFAALAELLSQSPGPSGADYWASRLRDAAIGRQVSHVGLKLQLLGQQPHVPAEQRMAKAQAELSSIDVGSGSLLVSADEAAKRALAYVDEQAARDRDEPVLGFGLRFLDELTSELRPGGLSVLAGRPSMGKTSVATNLARRAAYNGFHVLFVSLETRVEDLALNMGAQCVRETIRAVDTQPTTARQAARAFVSAVGDRLHLVDEGVRTVADVRRLAQRVPDLALVVVDYLQLLEGPPELARDPTASVGAVSKGLKRLAVDYDCHVTALAQLNRAVESRPNKRPLLSDLRQSGQIEQDADLILTVYRADYYDGPEEGQPEGVSDLELGVAKNRRGACGVAHVRFDRNCNLIEDWPHERTH